MHPVCKKSILKKKQKTKLWTKIDENEYNRIINCTCIYTVYLDSSKFVNLIVNMHTTAFYLQLKQANKQEPSERYIDLWCLPINSLSLP